jgi:hypothetical protein
MDKTPRQATYVTMGKYACYLFSLIYIAEKLTHRRFDAEQILNWAKSAGFAGDDCFLGTKAGTASAHYILGHLTGKRWTMRNVYELDYIPQEGEQVIGRYEWVVRESGMERISSHFVVDDGKRGIEYDPIGESNTVKNGKLVSLRVFTPEARNVFKGIGAKEVEGERVD